MTEHGHARSSESLDVSTPFMSVWHSYVRYTLYIIDVSNDHSARYNASRSHNVPPLAIASFL